MHNNTDTAIPEVIGRDKEHALLREILDSGKAEFLALYGRRRIGKTCLIRNFFSKKDDIVFFNVTGLKEGNLAEQLNHFFQQMGNVFYGGAELKIGKSWDEAFDKLTKTFSLVAKNKRLVLFFDELPWMATRNSRLLQAIDYYWNQHWSNDKRIKLIICGSSASWIINNIINNKGGLHNRITESIQLEPFTLKETEVYLKSRKIKLTREQMLLVYMVTGGVPYYLSKIKKGLFAAQIIEQLAFSKQGFLLKEFDNLFTSLFDDGVSHVKILRVIAKHRYGIGKRTLLEKLGKAFVGSGGTKKLTELEETGFIIGFKPLYHEKKGTYYRLTDEFTLFYFKWIEPVRDTLQKKSWAVGNWEAIQNTPVWYNWLGYAFESVCYKHIPQIRKALRISPSAIASAWRYMPRKGAKESGAQIDLLFDRKDQAITLCEIKYSNEPFVVTKDYAGDLKRKMKVFKEKTRTKKQLFTTLVTANGVKDNLYADDLISGITTLDDLFEA